jgi:hypothetical protein
MVVLIFLLFIIRKVVLGLMKRPPKLQKKVILIASNMLMKMDALGMKIRVNGLHFMVI